jgi:hypothetical protein
MSTSNITSEQVLAWLKAKADASGIPRVQLLASCEARFVASLDRPSIIVSGATAEEAFVNLRKQAPTHEQLMAKWLEDIAAVQEFQRTTKAVAS